MISNVTRRILLILFFATTLLASAYAQDGSTVAEDGGAGRNPKAVAEVEDVSIPVRFWRDALIVGEDGLAYLLAPTRFTGTDWAVFGGVAAGVGTLMLLDEDIRRIPARNRSAGLNDLSDALNWGGHLQAAEVGTGVIYLTGLLSGNDDIRIAGRSLAQTLIYSGSVYYAIAILAGRSRPYAEDGAYEFNTWQTDNEYQSFPSGHTVVAFSVATSLAESIDHWLASVVLYTAAAGVGLARLYQDHHWASDVFLGAVIGYTAGRFVSAQQARRTAGQEKEESWGLYPTGNGLMFSIRL